MSNPAKAAMTAMGTTTIWRSNDLNFKYSIVANNSYPEDKRTNLPVPLAGESNSVLRPALVQISKGALQRATQHEAAFSFSPASGSVAGKNRTRATAGGRRQQRCKVNLDSERIVDMSIAPRTRKA